MEETKTDNANMMRSELEASVAELLREANDDFSDLEDYLTEHEGEYDGDLWEYAFREAIRQGNASYVSDHVDDFDLNDEGSYSTYLYETNDSGMREILFDSGAFANMEDYSDCRFAAETVNCSIINFDPDFQREVFEKYLEVHDLTEEAAIRFLEEGIDEAEEEKEDAEEYCFEDDMEALGAEVEDGQISFRDMCWEEKGPEAKDLLESLGCD